MGSICKLSQLVGGNDVSPNPLTLGSPAVKVTITGRAGSTSPTITIVMWIYFTRCAVSNERA